MAPYHLGDAGCTELPLPIGHHLSLAQGRSVRSPNGSILLMCYGAFREPRAGALGSLTEGPHFVDVLLGIS